MTIDLNVLGRFDVVLYLGVLYHMESPLASLRRPASVTGDLAIIETHAVTIPGCRDLELAEFYSANQLHGDMSNWWGPNLKALVGMCTAAGFRRVEVVGGEPPVPRAALWRRARRAVGDVLRATAVLPPLVDGGRRHFRAVVHAWK